MVKRLRKLLYATSTATAFVLSFSTVYAAGLYDRAKQVLGISVNEAYGGGSKISLEGDPFSSSLILLINRLLTFVGIVFFLLLIYAGYLWMTARGNDEQVSKAKKMTREIVVGLIIILLARLLTELVLSQLAAAVK